MLLDAPVPAAERYWRLLPLSEMGAPVVFFSSMKSCWKAALALLPPP